MIEFLSQHTIGLGLAFSMIVNVILGLKQITSGSATIYREVADGYKAQNEQLERRNNELDEVIRTHTREIGELKGSLEAKNSHIKTLTDILQDRNPEVLALLEGIKELNTQLLNFLKDSTQKTKDELRYQTDMLEEATGNKPKKKKHSKK